ncbi:MAG TPA: amidohydrolase family protein [Puia sp.]|nr:amidohydrolase family protein [Puia sp.]
MKIISIFFGCALLLLVSRTQAQLPLGNYALTGVTIIDADHPKALARQTVMIRGKTISDVFADGSKPIPDSFNILSLKGKYLLPGLVDTHVHLATDPSGGDNREQTLNILRRMLYSGITTVRDMAGDARTLAGLSRDALLDDIPAPDIYYSALMAGPVFFSDPRTASSTQGGVPGKMPFMLAVTDSTNLVLAAAEAKGTGATGIKLYANLSPQLVDRIVAEASRQGLIVWSHAWLQGARPSDLVKAGVSSISHAPLVIYEKRDSIPGSWKQAPHDAKFWNDSLPDLSPLFRLMKAHHTLLDATLLTYKRWGLQDSTVRGSYEIGKRITAAAYKAGVTIVTGTDDDQELFVQKEMELLVSDAGLSNIDAIVAATLNGAMALRLQDSRGTVSPGKLADLLVLDKDPLADINYIESVYMVIKNGQVISK